MSEAHSDRIFVVEKTPTLDTNAFATGDLIGSEAIDLSSAVLGVSDQSEGGSGIIDSVVITDLDAQSANLDVLFFDTDPTNSTYTENAEFDLHDTDLVSLVGVAHITDWTDFKDNSMGQAHNLNIPFVLNTGATLFAVLVSRGAPTYGASGLTLRVGVLQV